MFTGIVAEIGKVRSVSRKGNSLVLEIACGKTLEVASPGDSVAVNGVCLTVTRKGGVLLFDVVANTASKTNLNSLRRGDSVNLENALKLGDGLSGHMVSGHIDGQRRVLKSMETSQGRVLDVEKLTGDSDLLIPKGSVALDGVSLTVAEDHPLWFRVFLIPYTLKDTTLREKRVGDLLNVEYDMLGKYQLKKERPKGLSIKDLMDKGFA